MVQDTDFPLPLYGKSTASVTIAAHTMTSELRDLETSFYAALLKSLGSRMEDPLCNNVSAAACLSNFCALRRAKKGA